MLDASGIIHVKDELFLVAEDEKDFLRYFTLNRKEQTFFASKKHINFGHDESDFESLAYDELIQRFYSIGSHGEDYSKRLISFSYDGDEVIERTEIAFDAQRLIKGKVDIEGLSVVNSRLFIAYRKPAIHDRALAVIFDIDSGAQLLTSFDLSGRTFRDIVRVDDENYLILAGPKKGKHYKKLPSCIFWWNGDIYNPKIRLCQVDLDNYRAEGIAVRINKTSMDVLIGSDESAVPSADCFRMLTFNVEDISGLFVEMIKPAELTVIK